MKTKIIVAIALSIGMVVGAVFLRANYAITAETDTSEIVFSINESSFTRYTDIKVYKFRDGIRFCYLAVGMVSAGSGAWGVPSMQCF